MSTPNTKHVELTDAERALFDNHLDVARSLARRYRERGISLEDLEQVAYLALVKAARRFDPDAGHSFMVFAVPTIRGELRRHFRDSGWMVRPPRRLQELQAHARDTGSELTHVLGRPATPDEIAHQIDVDASQVREAMAINGCFTPTSLDTPTLEGDSTLGDGLPTDGGEFESAEAKLVLRHVMSSLSAQQRRMLGMRFFDNATQQEIADEIGVTQSQVSRLLSDIYANLHAQLNAAAV